MSLSPDELFRQVDLIPSGPVLWRTAIPEKGSGVYVISIDNPSIVSADELLETERQHWLSDQQIVYIGRSNCLSRRLRDFYKHQYGQRRPHRGGQAILLLKCDLSVRWAAVANYAGAEHRLLEAFKLVAGTKPFGNRVRAARMRSG